MTDAERVANIMYHLKVDRAEAEQVLADDKRIARGEKLFELSKDQEKAAKKMRSVGRTPKPQTNKREIKIDDDKLSVFRLLVDTVSAAADVAEVQETTANSEFTFKVNGKKFKVTLSMPRK